MHGLSTLNRLLGKKNKEGQFKEIFIEQVSERALWSVINALHYD